MPYPRFDKLPDEKKVAVLDAAAREFAACGFEGASINRILEQASLSKGAAYYYFEDKTDLFCATVRYAGDHLKAAESEPDPDALTAGDFWVSLAERRRGPLLLSLERPWLFKVLNVAAQTAPGDAGEPLAALIEQITGQVMTLIRRGQALGVIRRDLPEELLYGWLLALDRASDDWLMSRWENLDETDVTRLSDQTVAALKAVFTPPAAP